MVWIYRGIPGSGKSTAARKMHPNCLILEQDMTLYKDGEYLFSPQKVKKAVKWLQNTLRAAVEMDMDVVVTGTLVRAEYVKNLIDIVHKTNPSESVVVYRMMENFGDIHNVPENVKASMKWAFEPMVLDIPLWWDGRSGEYITQAF